VNSYFQHFHAAGGQMAQGELKVKKSD